MKQKTTANFSALDNIYSNIDLQIENLKNMELLLTDYMYLFDDSGKDTAQLGYDADQQLYKLQIIDEFLLKTMDALKQELTSLDLTMHLYTAPDRSQEEPSAE